MTKAVVTFLDNRNGILTLCVPLENGTARVYNAVSETRYQEGDEVMITEVAPNWARILNDSLEDGYNA